MYPPARTDFQLTTIPKSAHNLRAGAPALIVLMSGAGEFVAMGFVGNGNPSSPARTDF